MNFWVATNVIPNECYSCTVSAGCVIGQICCYHCFKAKSLKENCHQKIEYRPLQYTDSVTFL